MTRNIFYMILLLYVSAIFYLAITLPIGPHEATLFYGDKNFLYYLTHVGHYFFGNGLEIRLPFVLFGFLNILLFFIMSRLYFTDLTEVYWATTIYLLLPGIITSTVLVNVAVIVITLVLFFIIFYEKKKILGQMMSMLLLLWIHDASIIFFIALTIYSAFKRDRILFSFSVVLSSISLLYFNELDIGGTPTGEFLQLFGLYVALFSPLVFIYFFYALYRIWIREKKDILWYIAFTAFIFSILLSLRQQVIMTDFAPYVIISVVLMLVIYNKSTNVRLSQFQKGYKIGFYILFSSLVLSALIIIFHKSFFYILEDKTKHFAYSFYEPYWQVQELKEIGQDCYTVQNQKIQYQLNYYGIQACQDFTVPKIHR